MRAWSELKRSGLQAGRRTRGHRFEAAVDPVVLTHADQYAETLKRDGAVIASFAERRAEIVRQLQAAAAKVGNGARPIEDEALLDEVTALVERPNVLTCQFETEFLGVPQECLILTMKANQKYFPLVDASGKLTNRFLVVSNITPDDASLVIGGNERVVRPRLADAKFFFDQDRKKTLESRVEGLSKVVYHNKLGTQGERVERAGLQRGALFADRLQARLRPHHALHLLLQPRIRGRPFFFQLADPRVHPLADRLEPDPQRVGAFGLEALLGARSSRRKIDPAQSRVFDT